MAKAELTEKVLKPETQKEAKTYRACHFCLQKIRPDERHVCSDEHLCSVCGRASLWCECEDKADRFSIVKVKMRSGKEMRPVSLVTICPIEFADLAREMAAEFLNNGELPSDMLDRKVGPIGASVPTHIMCERIVHEDEAARQVDFMWNNSQKRKWVSGELHSLKEGQAILDQFTTIAKEDEDALAILGLEEI